MESEAVAVICASEIIPVRLKVGVADILSEKVAVIVTTSELETILSESVSVKVTVTVFERTNSISSKKVVFPFEEEVVVATLVEEEYRPRVSNQYFKPSQVVPEDPENQNR